MLQVLQVLQVLIGINHESFALSFCFGSSNLARAVAQDVHLSAFIGFSAKASKGS